MKFNDIGSFYKERLDNIFKSYPEEPEKKVPEKTLQEAEKELKYLLKDVTKHNWRIHKRSIPVGLDQPIMFNLSEDEANHWLKKLKAKLIVYDEESGKRVVHYYEKVRSDGYMSGIYDNPKDWIKEIKINETNN